jgi:hypothetical protein
MDTISVAGRVSEGERSVYSSYECPDSVTYFDIWNLFDAFS